MSKPSSYAPKHRAAPRRRARTAPRLVRGAVVMSGLAVAATGMTVSGGLLSATPVDADGDLVAQQAAAEIDPITADDLTERQEQVSRSDRRQPQSAGQTAKAAALRTDQGQAIARTESISDADPREIGRALLAEYGFADDQFSCLDSLYVSESNWRVTADNPTSSAYGIPQALTSMHDLPADYMTSAEAQIRWGLEYIQGSSGSPCNAWSFKQGHGWY